MSRDETVDDRQSSEGSDDTNVLRLADGTLIDAATGRIVNDAGEGDDAGDTRPPRFIEVPTNMEAVAEVTRVRKRIGDLPLPPKQLNAVSTVAMYYLFGLSDIDIAYATGLTEAQVGSLRTHEAFDAMIAEARRNVLAEDGAVVRSMLEKNAVGAAQRVVSLLNSYDEKVQIVAAKDILDRAGHRPADVVEHRHKVEGGLRIEYVRKGMSDTVIDHMAPIDVLPMED